MALYTMKELLQDAEEKKYGIGYFNAVNLDMVRAYIRAAEECSSPIIIGTAEALLPYADFDSIVPVFLTEARNSSVPVAVHLDHCYTFDVLMRGLHSGFGSVMYDGSREENHEDNIRNSAELARIAHGMGVGIECELGSIGGLTDKNGKADTVIYTDPQDAAAFIDQTKVDFLAVSIGTVHGVYKAAPCLDIPRLREIYNTVDVPLVLHGGSGLSDDDFRNTIAGGIRKINVYTDIILAARKSCLENTDLPYTDMMLAAQDAMKDATKIKLELFGSAGKA